MASLIECIGSQILREAQVVEKLSAPAAQRLHRNLGLVTVITLAVLTGGLLLFFLEGAPHPAVGREVLTPDACRSLLTLAGSGLVIAGYYPVILGRLYRLWVTRRAYYAGIALASLSGVALGPSLGLSLTSLAPLLIMATLSPEQAANPACAWAAPACACGKAPKRGRSRRRG
ncbi:MAG: hypothetical protein ACOY93_08710 [Bacillota bacterium]